MMTRFTSCRWLAAATAICGLSLFLPAGNGAPTMLSIENKTLTVHYDETAGVFSVSEKASRSVFIKEGKLSGTAAKVQVDSVRDPVFGGGKSIRVSRAEGGVVSLELYAELPFVLIRGDLHNRGPAMADITRLVPATFGLDLGKPPSDLRTQGTAGLTAPDQNPGSYFFLTLADPTTRRGVVVGWLTADRFACV